MLRQTWLAFGHFPEFSKIKSRVLAGEEVAGKFKFKFKNYDTSSKNIILKSVYII